MDTAINKAFMIRKTTLKFRTKMTEIMTLGGGCFWCTEAVFSNIKGIIDVECGYAGSNYPNANYTAVCKGNTGLAEVIKIIFEPNIISYSEILEIFFTTHNPTTLNQQGADKGTQYRSVIFTHSKEQATTAKKLISKVSANWDAPITTEVTPINGYTRAEEEHQKYFARNPYQGYCQSVIQPKIIKLRAHYNKLLKDE